MCGVLGRGERRARERVRAWDVEGGECSGGVEGIPEGACYWVNYFGRGGGEEIGGTPRAEKEQGGKRVATLGECVSDKR